MKHAALALLLSAALIAPANAANRNFGVSGFDRVRLDGDFLVKLKVGSPPFAKATGSARALDGVSVRVEGRTLVIRAARSASWGGFPGDNDGPVTIEVGTHDLNAAWVNGAGSLAIDRVRGLKFEAAVQGAGMMSIAKLEVDDLDLSLAGSASALVLGNAKKVTTIVRGSSTLDGAGLVTRDAVIGAQGPAVITLTATETAKVDAIGVGSVDLKGNPACTVTVQGSATVTGCKPKRR